ncbi:MAG: glutamyl-tRNA reductase [Candidatus Syntrophoarchaeum sp.]|nr:glutamyl-tRNA reductase [Candidatus Syntrophoarchaeum sp.]
MIDMHKIGSLWFSHKKCSVEELEEVAERLNPEIFAEDPRVNGYAVIKTCNRVEAYISSEHAGAVLEDAVNRLKLKKSGIFVGKDALEHLMRVACGLEAMIVGEDQILGQIKKCYLESKKEGTIGSLLDMAFDRAIKVAKRARRETRINEGSVSIGSAAVELAEDITGGLGGKSILVIGAGEMGTMVARAISEKKLKAMFIANRTYERAKKLAEEVDGKAAKLDESERCLSVCDVAISTTSAPHYILDCNLMKRVMEHRRNDNDLLIIDIANPKDVEERVGEIEGIELYNLDSLYEISEENLKRRLSEVDKVEIIIEEEIELFKNILKRKEVERVIAMIYEHGSRVREEEKKRAISYMEKGRDPKEVLDDFSHAVLSKTLHTPTRILRRYVEMRGRGSGEGESDNDENNNSDFIDFLMDEFEKELEESRTSGSESDSD